MSRAVFDEQKAMTNMKAAGLDYKVPQQIRVVKQDTTSVVLRRRAELLQNIEYMQTQIGRLAKMARDVRAEILSLTVE